MFFLTALIFADDTFWQFFRKFYYWLLLVFTWYYFSLLFVSEARKRVYPQYRNEKIAVLIPCFNEPPEALERTVTSIQKAKGNKEIFLIDDGSTNDIGPMLRKLRRRKGVTVHRFKKNKGKRAALHYATKNLVTNHRFIVTVDSDTEINHDTLVNVVRPLKCPHIGAATGDVRLVNEKQNILTRMIGAQYWVSLNLRRKAHSAFGIVDCCSGAIAAHRAVIFKEIVDEMLEEKFFGAPCTSSEDRFLTNLVLQRGYDVVYEPKAVVYTETPATIKKYVKQQLRWKRGYVRDATYTLSYAWQNKKLLFFQVLFWDLTMPYMTLGIRLAVWLSIFLYPSLLFTTILPSALLFLCIRNFFVFIDARDKVPGMIMYMCFYECVLYWLTLLGCLTARKTGWITR